MATNIEKILEKIFKSISERHNEGYFINWNDLSIIYHTVKYCNVPIKVKKSWLNKLSELELSPETIEAANKDAHEQFQRVTHIMSIGNTWNDYEWSLVLLLRLELEMVKDFFSYKQLPFPPLELTELCKEMKESSENSNNRKAFSIAKMKKYSGLPFVDIWFQADESDIYKN